MKKNFQHKNEKNHYQHKEWIPTSRQKSIKKQKNKQLQKFKLGSYVTYYTDKDFEIHQSLSLLPIKSSHSRIVGVCKQKDTWGSSLVDIVEESYFYLIIDEDGSSLDKCENINYGLSMKIHKLAYVQQHKKFRWIKESLLWLTLNIPKELLLEQCEYDMLLDLKFDNEL